MHMWKEIKDSRIADSGLVMALDKTRQRMGQQFTLNQVLGRAKTIGCTAVEITQRCNLDCSLCYLSEHSESVSDIPIEEVFRRLDDVRDQYGRGAHVQITGGDPTLRKHTELVEIVAYAHRIGLFPALFTNGIAASRKLLIQLANAGLSDIAFHVDTTQKRKGYETEEDLNEIRLEYIERARGLGLVVIFNTTVHQGNFYELPTLVNFFTRHADAIGFVSFQLQADTGRGELGKRAVQISVETVRTQIEYIAGRPLPWDIVQVGHPQCHSYLPCMVINGKIHPVIEDRQLFCDYLDIYSSIGANRHSTPAWLLLCYTKALLSRPKWWGRAFRYVIKQLWQSRNDLLVARGRVDKLSFFIHNFMDADNLDQDRIEACSFMVMTSEGPVSMCAHNAQRDEYILKPITVRRRDGTVMQFNPLARKEVDYRKAAF